MITVKRKIEFTREAKGRQRIRPAREEDGRSRVGSPASPG